MLEYDMLTLERLTEVLDFDQEAGVFTWAAARPKVRVGEVAGCLDSQGYRKIKIDGRKYSAHRLAWLYVTGAWPQGDLDHRDLDKDNNRFSNLREADDSTNGANRRRRIDNATGFKRVTFIKKSGKYRASFGGRGTGGQIHLGCFDTPEAAHAAYCAAARKHFGEFARSA